MANSLKTDVIIVGAGPTGLSLAVQLLRYGVDFILIEKNEKTTHLSKAVVVQARTLEIFREIGLDKKAIDRGRNAMAFNMYHKGKKRAQLNLNGLGRGQSAFPYVLSLEQSKTEKLLAEYLAENGKTIHWNSEFTHLQQSDTGVTVNFKDAQGNAQTIEASYVVGCDGASSPVRHAAGITFSGDTIPKIFYVADAVLNSTVVNTDEMSVFLIDKGFILFFPMEGKGHYRIIGILPDVSEEQAANLTFSDIEASVKEQMAVPIEFEAINWFSHYKVHSRKAETFMINRCFIAGDAAHIHTPAGGQGMNTGIQDAYNIAWKLAYVLKGKSNMLATYNTERIANAENLLRTTDRMFDFMAGKHWYSDFFRLRLFPLIAGFISKNSMLNKLVFPLLSQTGFAYPDSILTIKGTIGNVKAGERMHYFEFADGKNIFDFLTEPNFKVIYFGKGNPEFNQLEPFEIVAMTFTEIPKKLFGDAAEFYVLLRPDNHISYLGNDSRTIVRYMAVITNQTLTS